MERHILHTLDAGALKESPTEAAAVLRANIPNRENMDAVPEFIRPSTRYVVVEHRILHALDAGALKEWPTEAAAVLRANIPNRENMDAVLEFIRPSTRYVAVVVDDATGEAVGALAASGDANITELAVAAAWRRKGVATMLLWNYVMALKSSDALTKYYAVVCPFRCFTHVTLDVDYDNAEAIAFYRKLGFTFVGTSTSGYPQFSLRCDVARLLLNE